MDQGKAVSYRDERQALLEKLAGYVNFTTQAEVNEQNKPTGFLNLFVDGKMEPPASHAILNNDGVVGFTNDWGQEFNLVAPVDPMGSVARVRAKIGSDGKLGRFEVLDGGSRYDDSEKPLLFTLLPPKTKDSTADQAAAGQQAQQQAAAAGGLQADPTLQAGQPVDDQVTNNTADDFPAAAADAAAAAGVALQSSEARKAGEVFYQGTNYYQALTNTIKDDLLADETKFMVISEPLPNGLFTETKRSFSDVESISKGEQVYYEGKLYQATSNVGPVNAESGVVDAATNKVATSRGYAYGEVFKYDGNFYQATKSVVQGTDLSEMSLPVDFGRGLVQIGPALPKKSEAAGLAWPNGNDLQAGEVFYFLGAGSTSNVDGAFFMAANAVSAASNADPSNSIKDFIRVGAFEDDTIQTVETLPR